jgi:hypothetical protein
MKDGYVNNGIMEMSRGGIQILNLISHLRGGYADPPTSTANVAFGFTQPTEILYSERIRRIASEKRPRGDEKFTRKKITLIPDPKFDLFTCFSIQGGNPNGA